MKILFENERIIIQKEGAQLKVYVNGNLDPSIIFKIDSHDNRLTALDIVLADFYSELQKEVIAELAKLLEHDEKGFGGKEFVLADEPYVALFGEQGFRTNLGDNKTTERVRVNTPQNMLEHISKLPVQEKFKEFDERFRFELDPNIAERIDDLMELMENSGFLPEKVADYKQKGKIGLYVMCHDSLPMVLMDKTSGKFVAFCRVSDINHGWGYLADTWVNEKYFDNSKSLGTAYLYQKVASICKENKISNLLLIAPPDRVEEFDSNYGCVSPSGPIDGKVVLAKFGPPKPELKLTYNEQAKNLEFKVKDVKQPSASMLAQSMPVIEGGSTQTKEQVQQASFIPTKQAETPQYKH